MSGYIVRFSKTTNFRQLHGCLVGSNEEARKAIESPEFDEAFVKFSEFINSRIEDCTANPVTWSEVENQVSHLSPLQQEGLKLILMLT